MSNQVLSCEYFILQNEVGPCTPSWKDTSTSSLGSEFRSVQAEVISPTVVSTFLCCLS